MMTILQAQAWCGYGLLGCQKYAHNQSQTQACIGSSCDLLACTGGHRDIELVDGMVPLTSNQFAGFRKAFQNAVLPPATFMHHMHLCNCKALMGCDRNVEGCCINFLHPGTRHSKGPVGGPGEGLQKEQEEERAGGGGPVCAMSVASACTGAASICALFYSPGGGPVQGLLGPVPSATIS